MRQQNFHSKKLQPNSTSTADFTASRAVIGDNPVSRRPRVPRAVAQNADATASTDAPDTPGRNLLTLQHPLRLVLDPLEAQLLRQAGRQRPVVKQQQQRGRSAAPELPAAPTTAGPAPTAAGPATPHAPPPRATSAASVGHLLGRGHLQHQRLQGVIQHTAGLAGEQRQQPGRRARAAPGLAGSALDEQHDNQLHGLRRQLA